MKGDIKIPFEIFKMKGLKINLRRQNIKYIVKCIIWYIKSYFSSFAFI